VGLPLQRHDGLITRLNCLTTRVAKDAFQRDRTEAELQHVSAGAIELLMGAPNPIDDSPAEVPIEYVEVELGKLRFNGLLAACPFRVGDDVQVVANGQLLLGLALPDQRLVALRPGCRRGRQHQLSLSLRRWATLSLTAGLIISALAWNLTDTPQAAMPWAAGGSIGFALVAALATWRYYLDKARLSCQMTEEILLALGVANAAHIDLKANSRAHAKGSEPAGYGSVFFRY
jgi:hypothetical protein